MTSSAYFSVTPFNSSVIGAPVTLFPLTNCVPPRRAHSARTTRAGAFWTVRFTSPPVNSSFTACAAAGPARPSRRAAPSAMRPKFMGVPIQYTGRNAFSLTLADVLDHRANDVVQAQCRLVTDELAELGNIGHPPRHVLEPLFIGLIIRNVVNRRRAAGHVLDLLRQFADGHLSHISDIEHFADRARLTRQLDQGADNVAH